MASGRRRPNAQVIAAENNARGEKDDRRSNQQPNVVEGSMSKQDASAGPCRHWELSTHELLGPITPMDQLSGDIH